MNIKIDRNSDYAAKLYDTARDHVSSILARRKRNRESVLNEYRGLKGERHGFLWLKKRERDETDEEVEGKGLGMDGSWALLEADICHEKQLVICENYIRAFESGREFSISGEELRYIR